MADLFANIRSYYFLLAIFALTASAVIGVVLATLWLGLLILVSESSAFIAERARAEGPVGAAGARALELASAAAAATGPALAWFSATSLGPPLAMAMLAALGIFTIFRASSWAERLCQLGPLALTAALFVAHAALNGQALAAFACFLTLGLGLGVALMVKIDSERAKREAEDARLALLDALNRTLDEQDGAAWDLDFQTEELSGAARLHALTQCTIDAASLMARRFNALDADRDLVEHMLSPAPGPTRRFSLCHAARLGNGAIIVLHHSGHIRADAQGRPLGLACVTRRLQSEQANAAPSPLEAQRAWLTAAYGPLQDAHRLDETAPASHVEKVKRA